MSVITIRQPHLQTGEPNLPVLPTLDSPVFDLTFKRSGQIIPLPQALKNAQLYAIYSKLSIDSESGSAGLNHISDTV